MNPVKVGIVGCGNISNRYFKAGHRFDMLDIVACSDLKPSRAKAAAKEWGVPKACSTRQLLADPEVELVVNLTIPLAHAPVGLAALETGKCLHTEKPLAVTREDGLAMVELAREKGVLLGAAPDTFLGAGLQTCRKLIDDGWIGEPIAAMAFMTCHGHENWHPDPEFYYKAGGGPMFDMGPYYLTALVNLMGPVARVSGSTAVTFPQRTITSEPHNGTLIDVDVPTHVAGTMDFKSGAIGTVVMSFDVWGAHLPCIEIHGTESSLSVPDPNGFGGTVMVKRSHRDWQEVPLTHGYADGSRGIGPADMAYALRTGRPHRANGDLAYHVLDIMHAFHDAADSGRRVRVKSTCARPAPLPMNLRDGLLDE